MSSTPVDEPAMTPWSPALKLLTIGALVTIAAGAFEALAVATVMPRVSDDLGGLQYYGWAFSAFTLANIVGLTIAGSESDRLGPGKPYLFGLVLFAIGILIAGIAPSMLVLIVGRVIQGFGSGLFNSSIYVVVGRAYPPSAKPRMLALMSSAWVMPGLIGPALAGVIADFTHWRVIFLGLLPFLAMAALMAYPRIREVPASDAPGEREWKRFGVALALAIGATSLFAGLGATSLVRAVPMILAGGVMVYLTVRWLMPEGTLRAAPGLPAAIATMALINFGFFGVDTFLPLALTAVRDRSTAFAGLALTAATISWSSGAWVQAHFSDKLSRRAVIRTGLALIITGCAGVMFTLFESVSVFLAIPFWLIAGFGIGLAYSGTSLTVLQTAESGKEGRATSAMQTASVLGFGFGAGIGGAWIAVLSEGDEVNRNALVLQDLLMIGLLALAIVLVRNVPAWPGRSAPGQPAATPAEPVPAPAD
jgi:MFS family permease